jgi:hypothetical protein
MQEEIADKPRRGRGQPTKYCPEMCEVVVEWGAQGWSQEEIAFELGVCVKTVHNWIDAHPDFLQAMTRAKLAEMVWWERAGRTGMVSDKFNNGVWAKSMSCRFPFKWRDTVRSEQTGANGGPIETRTHVINVIGVEPKADDA